MGTFINENDQKRRCNWCSATQQYQDYHDQDWGFPIADDRLLFEKLSLEAFQSGLSWRTILEKRENFRQAFANFKPEIVSQFAKKDVERLLQDTGIVRHRGKINAVINNANRLLELVEQYGSFAHFVWQYEPPRLSEDCKDPSLYEDYPRNIRSTCKESDELAKVLKKQGWKFVGPTTAYAFMQAMGMVNDHHIDCYLYPLVERAQLEFKRP
ncbi:MAG: DNA-3-methyladenine glycosylase I [Pseudomonadota bacterium]|nr:DNA-3-methyladenine glycosylase I [Pseudomonadota bacterium]